MTPSLVLGFALTVLPVPEMPRTLADRVNKWLAEMSWEMPRKRLRGDSLDDYIRLNLETARSLRDLAERMIAIQETLIAAFGDSFTLEEMLRLLRDLAADREELDRQEKWIEALQQCERQRKLNDETADEAV